MASLTQQRRVERQMGAGAKVLPAIHPNAGIRADYQRRLTALIDEMHKSVDFYLGVSYRANEPEMAIDAPDGSFRSGGEGMSPAMALRSAMRKLARRWQKRFDDLAPHLAKHFATSAATRTDAGLKAALKRAGFAVEFKLTAPMNDALQATIGENVALIKSIPAQYLTQVEGSVMRSVAAGRDLKSLTDDLQKHYGVTKRRAAFIALDQNNKATATITRVRQQGLGITEAIWLHSHGGREPRPTHVDMSGKRYKIADGMYDSAVSKNIFPGELPRCRCVSRSVVPGFD